MKTKLSWKKSADVYSAGYCGGSFIISPTLGGKFELIYSKFVKVLGGMELNTHPISGSEYDSVRDAKAFALTLIQMWKNSGQPTIPVADSQRGEAIARSAMHSHRPIKAKGFRSRSANYKVILKGVVTEVNPSTVTLTCDDGEKRVVWWSDVRDFASV